MWLSAVLQAVLGLRESNEGIESWMFWRICMGHGRSVKSCCIFTLTLQRVMLWMTRCREEVARAQVRTTGISANHAVIECCGLRLLLKA